VGEKSKLIKAENLAEGTKGSINPAPAYVVNSETTKGATKDINQLGTDGNHFQGKITWGWGWILSEKGWDWKDSRAPTRPGEGAGTVKKNLMWAKENILMPRAFVIKRKKEIKKKKGRKREIFLT